MISNLNAVVENVKLYESKGMPVYDMDAMANIGLKLAHEFWADGDLYSSAVLYSLAMGIIAEQDDLK